MYAMSASFLALWLAATPVIGAAQTPTEVECKPQTQIDVTVITPPLIVIGEMHGNEQTPAFVGGLVCSLLKNGRAVLLALEKDGMDQTALNRYLVSPGTPSDRQALLSQGGWGWAMQDGRSSAAMLALIEEMRRLRSAGHRVGLLAMLQSRGADLPRGGAAQTSSAEDHRLFSRIHERAMADNLVAASLGGVTVVALAGNVHTSTVAQKNDDPQWRSMAHWLVSMRPVFFIGLSSADGGTSWNCTTQGCGERRTGPGPQYQAGTQIDALAQLGRLSASPPALPKPGP